MYGHGVYDTGLAILQIRDEATQVQDIGNVALMELNWKR